jgi:D-beta-D-heptose 7-phosphate kinase/D-beta-D-heptose 1-phosphate adenosyltransferase
MFSASGSVIDAIERRFDRKRVVVVGDLMLDRHIRGIVSRISPEAPVPVVRVTHQTASPGGAGNVALNLRSLGLEVRLAGVVGEDAAAGELMSLLTAAGIDGSGIVRAPGKPTTTKARIIGGHQQMLRLDTEEMSVPGPAIARTLLDAVLARLDGAAAVVLSDYAKGVLTPELCAAVIAAAAAKGIPVLVDPKARDWEKFRGATLLTPNRSELAAVARGPVADLAGVATEARRLVGELGLRQLVVTLSEEGLVRVDGAGHLHIPAVAREVFDVSGAGDTVVATLAAGLAVGLHDDDALRLANLAAGVVVGMVGTVPITTDALMVAALAESQQAHDAKVCDLDQLLHRIKLWRARGDRIVFTNGCFDLLHAGHVTYLEKARAIGQRLIVGLNTDRSVRAIKGPERPVNHEQDRALVLSSLAAVDAVILFDDETPLALITKIRPDVLAKGADYTIERVVGATEVQSWGGEVALVPLVAGLSTTNLISRLGAGS